MAHPLLVQRQGDLAEIEGEMIAGIRARDKDWKKHNPKLYLTEYDLVTHLTQVKNVLLVMGEERGRPQEAALRESVALRHDVGKADGSGGEIGFCESLYRRRGQLTREERRVLRDVHQRGSGRSAAQDMKRLDIRYRQFMECVEIIDGNHHTPWLVRRHWLRMIAWDLSVADMFVAKIETRDRPGMSSFEAVRVLPAIVKIQTPPEVWLFYEDEIRSSIDIITRRYGLEAFLQERA